MKFHILKEMTVYQDFLRIKKAWIKHDRFDGASSVTYDRECLDKGDFATILLFEKDTKQIILVKQFRYPSIHHGDGWVLEIPAGGIEEGEDHEECAIREVYEETGYVTKNLEHMVTCYTSPGITNERMILYYAEVDQNDKTGEGGGNTNEDEDIELHKYSIPEIKELLLSGTINDAKTVIALQWYLLHKT